MRISRPRLLGRVRAGQQGKPEGASWRRLLEVVVHPKRLGFRKITLRSSTVLGTKIESLAKAVP